jgi:hypothetical protein
LGAVANYSTTATYTYGTVVYCQASGGCATAAQGSSYVYINASPTVTGTTNEPVNNTYWQQIAAAGSVGPAGPAGAAGANGTLTAAQTTQLANATTYLANLTGGGTVSSGNASGNAYGAQGSLAANSHNCSNYNFLGQIVLTPYNFALGIPADGRLLSISQNEALFSLIGTTYGGNGSTTFGVPDMRSVTPANMIYSICGTGIYPTQP